MTSALYRRSAIALAEAPYSSSLRACFFFGAIIEPTLRRPTRPRRLSPGLNLLLIIFVVSGYRWPFFGCVMCHFSGFGSRTIASVSEGAARRRATALFYVSSFLPPPLYPTYRSLVVGYLSDAGSPIVGILRQFTRLPLRAT